MAPLLSGLVVGLPEDVRASLVARSEGVPLFAVETVRSLIDKDLVVPRGGQYVLADPDALDLDSDRGAGLAPGARSRPGSTRSTPPRGGWSSEAA